MACFLVPAAEAIVTTIATKVIESKEKEPQEIKISVENTVFETVENVPFSRKLKWLSNLLWGGSALLTFEHVWHGEVVPWFPFLTATSNPADTAEMLREMATAGITMTAVVTGVWIGMLAVTSIIEKRAIKQQLQTAAK